MEMIAIAVCAFGASLLTLYSGFGLGTLLLPVFALFYPVETAVAATAVIHFANNILKAATLGRNADRGLVWRFGLPAVVASFVGAALLGVLSGWHLSVTYTLWGQLFIMTPLKWVMAGLMIFFALFELHPRLKNIRFERRHLVVGGVLSGFFGGLSGHQGALRATFLTKTGVTPEAFVGSNALIGLMVDAARLLVYGTLALAGALAALRDPAMTRLLLTGVIMAGLGVVVGKRFLRKVTMTQVQTITGFMLLLIALAMGMGAI